MLNKIVLLALIALSVSMPSFAAAEKSPSAASETRAVAEFFGIADGKVKTLDCQGKGTSCSNTFDCCSNWCKDGVCYEIGGGCQANGTHCSNTFDCCSNWCKSGVCYEIAGKCQPKGTVCGNTFDCCSNWCSDGICK
ncbi:MAG: hypothetical protein ACXWQE_08380 [Bdellovibrionales bacterium]